MVVVVLVFDNGFPTILQELKSYVATPFVSCLQLVFLLHPTKYLRPVEI